MKINILIISKWSLKVICLISTSVFIIRGINRYFENNDVTSIESPTYKNDELSIFPAISLCFYAFEDATFEKLGLNVIREGYRQFLVGEHFDKRLLDIKYEDVSKNLSEIMLCYFGQFHNGTWFETCHGQVRTNAEWRAHGSYSWDNWGAFQKCFTLQMADVNVERIAWVFSRSVFPNRTRPTEMGRFSVLLHYPYQILDSLNTIKRVWPPTSKNRNYYVDYEIVGMNVFQRRYKPTQDNCIHDWKNYDTVMVERHIATVGCKAPYQNTIKPWPICNSKEKMKETKLLIQTGLTPSCRTIENVEYRIFETDGGEAKKVRGTYFDHWFAMSFRPLNNRFTIKINKKEMNFESLVGYIGGYVGLFVGFAVTEIPEILSNGVVGMKELYILLSQAYARNGVRIETMRSARTV